MRVDQRRGVGIEIDDQRRQQSLPLDPALLALALEPLIDDALMRRVLVDDDHAVPRLGDDVVLVHLRPRRAKRSGEVALAWPRGRRGRGGRDFGEARLRGLREPRRRGRGAPVPAGRIGRAAIGLRGAHGEDRRRPAGGRGAMQRLVQMLLDRADDQARTAAASRKRTSAFAGWTLTSTSLGSHSTNKAATACRSGGRKSR